MMIKSGAKSKENLIEKNLICLKSFDLLFQN